MNEAPDDSALRAWAADVGPATVVHGMAITVLFAALCELDLKAARRARAQLLKFREVPGCEAQMEQLLREWQKMLRAGAAESSPQPVRARSRRPRSSVDGKT